VAPSPCSSKRAGWSLADPSCDVSLRFLVTYVGGYAIWLLYGVSIRSAPIVLVHSLGLLTGVVTLAVALRLRGPLLRSASWSQCD
jgi:hypothetical protein